MASAPSTSFHAHYKALVASGAIEADPAQQRAAEAFAALEQRLDGYTPISKQGLFGRLFAGKREVEVGEGSGFIFHSDDKASWILTNAHVVLQTNADQQFIAGRNGQPVGYDTIAVILSDNRELKAEYVGVYIESDLAVLKIPVPNLGPRTITAFLAIWAVFMVVRNLPFAPFTSLYV